MASGLKTIVVIRVQAKGGKFLGDDIGGASVTIRDSHSAELLASGFTSGGSGLLSLEYDSNASQRAIVTPGEPPVIRWLVADPTTSQYCAELMLEEPTLLEISAFGSLAGLQTAHKVSATQWVVPGEHIDGGPGFVVELPGLIVQIMEPATHLELSEEGTKVPLKAHVAMMCGCPIRSGGPWLSSDFDVAAQISLVGSPDVTRVPLEFSPSAGDGIFVGSYTVARPGFYSATTSAIQRSTGNTGAGQVTFLLKS